MFPSMEDLMSALSKIRRQLRALARKTQSIDLSRVLKFVTGLIFFIRDFVKSADPLKLASAGSRAFPLINLAISTLCVLIAEDKIDELANQVCSLALGFAGATIGGAIGLLGGPIGATIGACVGGAIGGFLGMWAYPRLKNLFTQENDGLGLSIGL